MCTFYKQARTICITIDQDSDEYELIPNYEEYPCDIRKNHGEKDFVKYNHLRWYYSDRIPDKDSLNFPRMKIEVRMSRSPQVQTLMNMDTQNFSMSSSNYHMESIIMLFLSIIFCIAAICIFTFKTEKFTNVTLE